MEIERSGLFSCRILSEKEAKNLEMLELIRREKAFSRTDISKTTGINIVSVSNYIKNYIDKKLVLEKGFGESSGGRKPELVELNLKNNYVAGIEISADRVSFILADFDMTIVSRDEKPVLGRSAETAIREVPALAKNFLEGSKIAKDKIRAIGVALPQNGFLPVCRTIESDTGIPVFAAGYAACEAFGEKRMNKDADVDNLLFIYSDLGRGIVIKDSACFGAVGATGEIYCDEVKPPKSHNDISYEQSKYLQPWPGDLGIVSAARNEVARGIGTKMVELASGKVENINDDIIIKAVIDKDEVALSIVNSVGTNLGLRISYLINLFEPETVVLGGGLEKYGNLMIDKIKQMVNTFVLKRLARNIKIAPSLLGKNAVGLGAASIAVREVFLRA